jgi:UDP-N-acetyl-D-glucosamine dehydrogenase
LTTEHLASLDCVVIVTDHEAIDWKLVAEHAPLIIDTRNVITGYHPRGEVWKA